MNLPDRKRRQESLNGLDGATYRLYLMGALTLLGI